MMTNEMTKKANAALAIILKSIIENATPDWEYDETISNLMRLDPETSGFFYRKNENGEVEYMVDDGQCYPTVYPIEKLFA